MRFSDDLKSAKESQTIVRIYRDKAISNFIVGYIVGISEDYLAVLVVEKGVRHDGFIVIRLQDVSALRIPGDWYEFSEMALKKRCEVRPVCDIDLHSWKTIIESSRDKFPIARFQCFDDESYSHVTWTTGHAVDVSESTVRIRPIDPGAVWKECEEVLAIDQLLRLDFGDDLTTMLGELSRDSRSE